MTTRLQPGDTAPAFDLPTHDGNQLSLTSLQGHKVILYAYPAAMTPGCTKQACDFRDNLASLQAAGYHVVGISPDKPEKLAKFATQLQRSAPKVATQLQRSAPKVAEPSAFTFPLVSDPDKTVLTAYGAFGEKKNYGRIVQGVIRSTFVIDENGTIEVAQYNVRATGHVAKLRRDLGLD